MKSCIEHAKEEWRGSSLVHRLFLVPTFVLLFLIPLCYFHFGTVSASELVRFENPSYLVIRSNFPVNFIRTVFNLNNFEMGQYRPRLLSFIVTVIDTNIWYLIARQFKGFIPFLPLTVPFLYLNFAVISRGIRRIMPGVHRYTAMFLSAAITFSQSFMCSVYYRTRSSKLLIIPVTIMLLFWLYNKKEKESIFLFFFFTLLCTLDEMVLTLFLLMSAVEFAHVCSARKISRKFIIIFLTLIMYLIYYKAVGPAVFGHFTSEITEHGHVKNMLSGSMYFLWGILLYLESWSFFLSVFYISHTYWAMFLKMLFGLALMVFVFIRMMKQSKGAYGKAAAIYFFLYPLVLSCVIVEAHNPVFANPALNISLYTVQISVFVMGMIMWVSGPKIRKVLIALFLISSVISFIQQPLYHSLLTPGNPVNTSSKYQIMDKAVIHIDGDEVTVSLEPNTLEAS